MYKVLAANSHFPLWNPITAVLIYTCVCIQVAFISFLDIPSLVCTTRTDFIKGLSPVSGSNLRFLSEIIEKFYSSPWAQPLWISQMVSVSALAEPLAQMLRLVGSGLKFCK